MFKIGSLIKIPVWKDNVQVEDIISDIEVDIDKTDNTIDVTVITKNGYIVYCDELEYIEIIGRKPNESI